MNKPIHPGDESADPLKEVNKAFTLDKADPLSYEGNVHLNREINDRQQTYHALQVLKKLFVLCCSILLFAGLGCVILYFAFREQVEEEVIIASQSVSDISMALIHAHMHHATPPNQNWYDSTFLKDHLEAVLVEQNIPLCHLDSQGQFKSCPYILRIYTDSSQARFLLIAQPSPSLLQWLIPKAAIIVDSQTMELRQIEDLKKLNRLLINSNTLDDIDQKALSSLVEEGTIIPFSSLTGPHGGLGHHSNADFLLPRELTYVRPGIDTFIYNAPRYYKIDAPLILFAIKNNTEENFPNEENHQHLLKQEFDRSLSLMPNKIFYVTNGIEEAIRVEKVLTPFEEDKSFLLAYLTLNPTNGQILNSHLLLMNQAKKKNNK